MRASLLEDGAGRRGRKPALPLSNKASFASALSVEHALLGWDTTLYLTRTVLRSTCTTLVPLKNMSKLNYSQLGTDGSGGSLLASSSLRSNAASASLAAAPLARSAAAASAAASAAAAAAAGLCRAPREIR